MTRVVLTGLVALLTLLAGCTSPVVTPPGGDGNGTVDGGSGPDVTPPGGQAVAFNATRALAFAEEQVLDANGSVRHRVPGTPGNTEAAHLIAGHLADAGLAVRWHHFNATYGCEETPMHNVVGVLEGTSDRTFYVGAHYDTRPIAEKDPDAERRDEPIPGANDGASGVGVLLELARVVSEGPPLDVTLVFVFFDGEDGGGYGGKDCTDWILGSRAFASALAESEVEAADGMILVDLVGDPEAVFPREGHSAKPANRPLGDAVWAIANGLGFDRFTNGTHFEITDDHLPFIERGIPAIDIIDLRGDSGIFPPTHHTHADDLENLDPQPLGEVGTTLQWFLVESYG